MRNLLFQALFIGAFADYWVNLRLCSDKNRKTGVLQDAIGANGKLFLINDVVKGAATWKMKNMGATECNAKYCKWQLNGKYNYNYKDVMKLGPFPGQLKDATFIAIDYRSMDILCVEEFSIVGDGGLKLDILENYISWAWDPSLGRQNWESRTNRKLAYWSTMCSDKSVSDDNHVIRKAPGAKVAELVKTGFLSDTIVAPNGNPLVLTAPFHQSCRQHIVVQTRAVDECRAGTHNCHDHATCTDTKHAFSCRCKPGYLGNGFKVNALLSQELIDEIGCKLVQPPKPQFQFVASETSTKMVPKTTTTTTKKTTTTATTTIKTTTKTTTTTTTTTRTTSTRTTPRTRSTKTMITETEMWSTRTESKSPYRPRIVRVIESDDTLNIRGERFENSDYTEGQVIINGRNVPAVFNGKRYAVDYALVPYHEGALEIVIKTDFGKSDPLVLVSEKITATTSTTTTTTPKSMMSVAMRPFIKYVDQNEDDSLFIAGENLPSTARAFINNRLVDSEFSGNEGHATIGHLPGGYYTMHVETKGGLSNMVTFLRSKEEKAQTEQTTAMTTIATTVPPPIIHGIIYISNDLVLIRAGNHQLPEFGYLFVDDEEVYTYTVEETGDINLDVSGLANGAHSVQIFTLFGASNKKTLTTFHEAPEIVSNQSPVRIGSEIYEQPEEDREATKGGFVFPESMQMDFVYEDEEKEEEQRNNSKGYWAITKKIDNMRILAEFVAERENEVLSNEFAAWAVVEGAKLERELLRKLKSL